jgi:hypothetical protein
MPLISSLVDYYKQTCETVLYFNLNGYFFPHFNFCIGMTTKDPKQLTGNLIFKGSQTAEPDILSSSALPCLVHFFCIHTSELNTLSQSTG